MLSKCQDCKFFHPDLCAVNPSYRSMEGKLRSRFTEQEILQFDIGIIPCHEFELSQYLQPVTIELTLSRQAWLSMIINTNHPTQEFFKQVYSAIELADEARMIPVDSSNIAALGYNIPQQMLIVDFLGGARYHYFDVAFNIFEEFLSAESKGRFLNSDIKGNFNYQRV